VAERDYPDRSIAQLISLAGRTAVITGAAAGIGLGIAHRLAEAGANVVVADRASTAAAVTAVHEKAHSNVIGFELDMADGTMISRCVEFTIAAFGRLDIWVNNAGIYPAATALELTDQMWDDVHNVNLRGAFIAAREAAKTMVASGTGGVIINVASTAAFRATGFAHYVASKHGLHGLTKALASELGPLGVRVLSVAPGMIATPGMVVRTQHIHDIDIYAAVAEKLPLRRVGGADDVARVVLFAASDLAAFMTGSVLFADGGDMVN
jgi:NAD(P)-dependent dehydrogenase (short-subunit alcohol dehydrogenase family)